MYTRSDRNLPWREFCGVRVGASTSFPPFLMANKQWVYGEEWPMPVVDLLYDACESLGEAVIPSCEQLTRAVAEVAFADVDFGALFAPRCPME